MKCAMIRKTDQCNTAVFKLEKNFEFIWKEQTRLYHYRHCPHYHYDDYYNIVIITIVIIIINKIWIDTSEIIASLTCAHPTHHLTILQDFCSLTHFWFLFISLAISFS